MEMVFRSAGKQEQIEPLQHQRTGFFLNFVRMQNAEKKQNGAAMNLSKGLFWDTDYDTIDWDKKARYVIGRVVTRGNWSDWLAIQEYYGLDRIRTEMLQERYLDKKALNFLSNLFSIPKTQFRCYILQQSNPGHWDF